MEPKIGDSRPAITDIMHHGHAVSAHFFYINKGRGEVFKPAQVRLSRMRTLRSGLRLARQKSAEKRNCSTIEEQNDSSRNIVV